jgi:hypothetical protein
VQHEELGFKHTVGQAKFLEEPLYAARPAIQQRLNAITGRNVQPPSGGPITPGWSIGDDDIPDNI